jgi:signal peptidase II
MNICRSLCCYASIATGVLLIDRSTKWLALTHLDGEYRTSSFLSFDLIMNRGISWSLFHSTNTMVFGVLTTCITLIIGMLMVYTIRRWYAGYMIFGEVLTISGALSNLIDRIIYGGVIDFIVVSAGSWVWPVFNIADCCIVLGIAMMTYTWLRAEW